MRQPELLADGAGKVELLLELSCVPSASCDIIAEQLAEHHHPTHGHGLLSVVVCFEALAALAPVLRLDSPVHDPNHRQLEPWLVHVPPRAYWRHSRWWIMWTLHTLLPVATILWGLWQLYFNIPLFHQLFRSASEWIARVMGPILNFVWLALAALEVWLIYFTECIERVMGPILNFVWLALAALQAWLIYFTDLFNVWLRPLKIVLQPVVKCVVWLFTPVCRLARRLQPAWSAIIKPLARRLQPVRSLLESAATVVAKRTTQLLGLVRALAGFIMKHARAIRTAVAGVFGRFGAAMNSSRLGKAWQWVIKKLPSALKIRPKAAETEAKAAMGHIYNLGKKAQEVVSPPKAAAQISRASRVSQGDTSIEVRRARVRQQAKEE